MHDELHLCKTVAFEQLIDPSIALARLGIRCKLFNIVDEFVLFHVLKFSRSALRQTQSRIRR